jgi:hypothetical protein
MNPHYRLKNHTHYPAWHHKPLRLSIAELEDPWLVLREFFDMFRLPNIRDSLKFWLDETANCGSEDFAGYMNTKDLVEKLVEAAYLLHRQKERAEDEENEQEYDGAEEAPEEKEISPGSEGQERKRFAKRPFGGIRTGSDPVNAISKVFRTKEPDALKEIIKQWCKIALTNEKASYEEAFQREDLLAFCEELEKLVEALYCIHRVQAIEERSGFPLAHLSGLQPAILQKEQSLRLSYEEQSNPGMVLHHFFERFTPGYVRAELLGLLESAVSCGRADFDKHNLVLEYQCLYTLAEAAWMLEKTPVKEKEK